MTSPLSSAFEAMKDDVPTSRHAEMLFETLADLLGEQGVLRTANGGRLRTSFRRAPLDASLVVPWPVARLSVAAGTSGRPRRARSQAHPRSSTP